jgi:Mrp family chromosome partitioning ATPase
MMRRKKRKLEPIEANTGLTLLGEAREPMIAFPADVVQPLRHMATLMAAKGTLPPRLGLVSALREEGVTYISLALATILAYDLPGRVGLVELNWEAPGLARLVGGETETGALDAGGGAAANRWGLAAVLTEEANLDEVLLATGLPNLALLPAGQLPLEGRETLVRSVRLREILDQLAGRFDYLLFDIPAVAATSDAIPLARLSDAILLIIRQGITPRRAVATALDDLSACTILGTVLNRAKVATPAWIMSLVPED